MPTVKKRIPITETDDVKEALRAAADHWPHLRNSPTALLNALIEAGHVAIVDAEEARRRAIDENAGTLGAVFPPGYLEELRQDWPE